MKLARLCAFPLVFLVCLPLFAAGPQAPTQFLGFEVGADRTLADYRQIASYFKHLSENSPRVQVETLGKTTNGNDMFMAVISAPENLKSKAKYQEIAHKLADPRGLTPQQLDGIVKEGKAILMVTCNIHSTEIASSQMAMEWAYALATAQDPETLYRLSQVILLLVPSQNPDGQIMETEWYRQHLGTKYEGGRMPWLYHPYVGHDNNRDFYMLTQKETRNTTRAAYKEWYPQVWLDEHQMGSNGPRLFVPPYTDPIGDEVHPLMWRGIDVIGTTMAWRLEQQGKSGVIYGYVYDQYWPGAGDGTPQFKNIFGLLTEAASVRLATPINLAPTELTAGGKGLIEYRRTANFPSPWPGGAWRLRDIMDYERIASDAILETVAHHKEDFMRGTAEMALEQVKAGRPDQYWRIPRSQYDSPTAAKLAFLLREHAIEVMVSADGKDFLVPTAQPYGKFAGTLLSNQRYPKVRVAQNAPILRPYDVTAWTLPLLMGVEVSKATVADRKGIRPIVDNDWPAGGLDGSGTVFAVSHQENNVSRLVNKVLKSGGSVSVAKEAFTSKGVSFPAGTVLFAPAASLGELASANHIRLTALQETPKGAGKLKNIRVGLYKPWSASMDEGWTRWLLEQYDFDLKSLENKTIAGGKLNESLDVIVFPDMDKNVIIEGKPRSEGPVARFFEELPPEYAGGIGKDGVKALKDFVAAGGTIVTLGSSGDLLIDEFGIPVRNALAGSGRGSDELSAPGSLLRMNIDNSHPVGYGMPAQAAAFVSEPLAYTTFTPTPDIQRAILAWYPTEEEDILLSGYLQGANRLARRATVVSFTQGKGKLVLFGFRVQNRAQTEGTFKLLFNAIHWAGME
jgi:hypothetical protein